MVLVKCNLDCCVWVSLPLLPESSFTISALGKEQRMGVGGHIFRSAFMYDTYFGARARMR
jgi:hypothetical protein